MDKKLMESNEIKAILEKLRLEVMPTKYIPIINGIAKGSDSQVESYINVFMYGASIGQIKIK